MQLSEKLVLGAATAAYQIEGSVKTDGRGASIWDVYSHTPGRIADATNGDIADDHYRRMDDDLDLMASLGLQAYRFSIAWSRIIPDGTGASNPLGIDFYSRLVDGLLERGIAPVATLYHWDLPQTLEERGGWTERSTAQAMADYATVIGAALGDRVTTWTTLNEPWCSAYLGYGAGTHAPGHTDPVEALRAVHHLNLAHGLAVESLRREVTNNPEMSVTLNLHSFRTEGPTGAQARRKLYALANDAFLMPMLEGKLSEDLVAATESFTDWSFVEPGDLAQINQPIDLLGVNYYYTHLVRMREAADELPIPGAMWPGAADIAFLPTSGPKTEMGWNIDPLALTEMLLDLHQRFGIPLAVTENGAAFPDVLDNHRVADPRRIDYIRRHLEAIADAMIEGADVRGYYLWTLMDNFEWSFGFTKRFGLVFVDFESQERILKDSALWYRDVVRSRNTSTPAPE